MADRYFGEPQALVHHLRSWFAPGCKSGLYLGRNSPISHSTFVAREKSQRPADQTRCTGEHSRSLRPFGDSHCVAQVLSERTGRRSAVRCSGFGLFAQSASSNRDTASFTARTVGRQIWRKEDRSVQNAAQCSHRYTEIDLSRSLALLHDDPLRSLVCIIASEEPTYRGCWVGENGFFNRSKRFRAPE